VDVAAWLVQGCQFQRNVRELVKEPKVPVRGALEPVVRLTEFLVSKGAACIILVIDGRRYLPKEQAGVRAKRNAALQNIVLRCSLLRNKQSRRKRMACLFNIGRRMQLFSRRRRGWWVSHAKTPTLTCCTGQRGVPMSWPYTQF